MTESRTFLDATGGPAEQAGMYWQAKWMKERNSCRLRERKKKARPPR